MYSQSSPSTPWLPPSPPLNPPFNPPFPLPLQTKPQHPNQQNQTNKPKEKSPPTTQLTQLAAHAPSNPLPSSPHTCPARSFSSIPSMMPWRSRHAKKWSRARQQRRRVWREGASKAPSGEGVAARGEWGCGGGGCDCGGGRWRGRRRRGPFFVRSFVRMGGGVDVMGGE